MVEYFAQVCYLASPSPQGWASTLRGEVSVRPGRLLADDVILFI